MLQWSIGMSGLIPTVAVVSLGVVVLATKRLVTR